MSAHAYPHFSNADFVKSSYCVYPPGGCVEVAVKGDVVAVRDAKHPGRILHFTKAEWSAFVQGVKAGEFDVN